MIESNKLIRGAGGGKGGGGGGGGGLSEDANTLHSKAKVRLIDLISEGEIYGLLNAEQSIFLDKTPLKNTAGEFNYENVFWASRVGTNYQSHIAGFPGIETEIAVNLEVKNGSPGPHISTISTTNLDALRVTIYTPNLTEMDDQGGIHGSKFSFKIYIEKDNNGSWLKKVDASFDGKTNTKYERSYRIDIPDSWKSAGFTQIAVKMERTTADSSKGSLQNSSYFGSYTKIIDNKLRYPNSALQALEVTAKEFTSVPKRGYEIKGLKIKVPSNYTPYDAGHCSLSGYRRKDRCTQAGGTWSGTSVGDNLYSGSWDGTFTVAWSSNPAWVYYDMCTEERYGLGRWLTENQIDKWALYEIAKYCDAVDNSGNFVGVDDGWGNKEARFNCNIYISKAVEAYKLLNDLTSIFRSMSYWQQGQIVPIQDSPKEPVMNFSDANVLEGAFTYEGSSAKARHNVAHVTWNDPEDFYKQNVEYVEDADGIALANNQIISKQITAVGCTSQGQARRLGKWLLYTEKYETEVVTFRTGLEGAMVLPGDIINVADSHRAGIRYGGRIPKGTILKTENIPNNVYYDFTSDPITGVSIAFDPNNPNKFIAIYVVKELGWDNGKAVVGTISGTTISYGSEYTFSSTSTYATRVGSIAFDPNTPGKFVIVYNRASSGGFSIVGTVSGSTITYGTEASFSSPWNDGSMKVSYVDTNKFIVLYRASGAGKSVIGNISGTSITYGTSYEFASYVYNNIAFDKDPKNTNKFVLAYIDSNAWSKGKAVVGTISGTTISYGSTYEFNSTNWTPSVGDLAFDSNTDNNDKFILTYEDGSSSPDNTYQNGGIAIIGTLSGTTLTFGSKNRFDSADNFDSTIGNIVFDPNNPGSFSIFHSSRGITSHLVDGRLTLGVLNGDNINYTTTKVISDEVTTYNKIVFDPHNSGKFLLAYKKDPRPGVAVGTCSIGQTEDVFSSSTNSTILLDNATPVTSGKSYTLSLIHTEEACIRDGVKQSETSKSECINAHVDNEWKPHVWVETKNVNTVTTTESVSSLSVTSPFTNLPTSEHMWILEETGSVAAQKFRVINVKEHDKEVYQISALKYHEDKYALVEQNIAFSPKTTSILPNLSDTAPAPSNLTITEELYKDSDNRIRNRGFLSWCPAGLSDSTCTTGNLYKYTHSYYVEYRRKTPTISNWVSLGETTSIGANIDDAPVGTYEFRVKTNSIYNKSSSFASSGDVALLGKTAAPGSVATATFTATTIP